MQESTLRPWLVEEVAAMLGRAPEQIEPGVPLADYGLDSVYGLTFITVIEDHLGITLDPAVIWDHPSIDALVGFLTGEQVASS